MNFSSCGKIDRIIWEHLDKVVLCKNSKDIWGLCITSSQHISTPQIWHISTPQKGTSPPPKEHISTPQKDSFHTPTEIFSKDKNDKIKSESECVCSSGSCGGLGGGPHRAEPDHVQRQTGVRSRWRSTTFWRWLPLPCRRSRSCRTALCDFTSPHTGILRTIWPSYTSSSPAYSSLTLHMGRLCSMWATTMFSKVRASISRTLCFSISISLQFVVAHGQVLLYVGHHQVLHMNLSCKHIHFHF